jgi:Iap family predicted aminopeptidase
VVNAVCEVLGVYAESILPGSVEEREYTRRLLGELREHVDWIRTRKFPVYAWSSSCVVEVDGVAYKCVALPYSPSAIVETKPSTVRRVESEAELYRLGSEEVLLVRYPESPVELRWLYYTLSGLRVRLVALYTRGEFLKADTVLGTPGFTSNPSAPPRTPVICLARDVATLLERRPATVRVDTRLTSGEAALILAGLNGSGEEEVHVVGYHDTVVGGSAKTSSRLLTVVARLLKDSGRRVNVVLVSYSAREVGDGEFTEFHFAWGLRYLLGLLEARGELVRVRGALVLGPLHSGGGVRAITHPALGELVFSATRGLQRELLVEHDNALSESHVYATRGIAAVTLTTLPTTWFCHNSTLSCAEETVNSLVLELVPRVVVKVSERDYGALAKELSKHIVESLGETVLEARGLAVRAGGLSRALGDAGYLREATRLCYEVFYAMCSKPFTATLHSGLLVDVSARVLELLRRVLVECSGDLVIGNSNWYVALRGGGLLADVFLRSYIEKTVKSRNLLIDSSIVKALCERALKGSAHGVEEHRNRQVREL